LLIESSDEIDTDIDGEHGEKLPLEFSVLNKRLEVFVSKDRWHYN
jgi:diacylglycerol kinase family enzyme